MAIPTINLIEIFRRIVFWSKWTVLNPVLGFVALSIAFTRFFNGCLAILYQNLPSIDSFGGFFAIDNEWQGFLMYTLAADQWLILFKWVVNTFNMALSAIPGVIVAWWTAQLIFGKQSYIRRAFDYVLSRGV